MGWQVGKQEITSNAKCKIRTRLNTCARDECAGRCDVTNTDRSPQTLPRSQKPLRINTFAQHNKRVQRDRRLHARVLLQHADAVIKRRDWQPRIQKHIGKPSYLKKTACSSIKLFNESTCTKPARHMRHLFGARWTN